MLYALNLRLVSPASSLMHYHSHQSSSIKVTGSWRYIISFSKKKPLGRPAQYVNLRHYARRLILVNDIFNDKVSYIAFSTIGFSTMTSLKDIFTFRSPSPAHSPEAGHSWWLDFSSPHTPLTADRLCKSLSRYTHYSDKVQTLAYPTRAAYSQKTQAKMYAIEGGVLFKPRLPERLTDLIYILS